MYVDIGVRRCWSRDYEILTNEKEKKTLINYVKNYLIDSGLYDKYRLSCKVDYYMNIRDNILFYDDIYVDDWIISQICKYEKYVGYDVVLTDLEIDLCIKIFNNNRARVLRLKKKLFYRILNFDCLFLTLTFTDKILDSTSEHTRRTYVSRFLKSLDVPFYVANIDYGELNEREHYHAIVQAFRVNPKLYPYGRFNVKRIVKSDVSTSCLSHYINKISAHAFKSSTGQCRLIYSRPVHEKKCLQLSF